MKIRKTYSYLLFLTLASTISFDLAYGMRKSKKKKEKEQETKEFIIAPSGVPLSETAKFNKIKTKINSIYKEIFSPEKSTIYFKEKGQVLPNIQDWYAIIDEVENIIKEKAPVSRQDIFLSILEKIKPFNQDLINGIREIQRSAYTDTKIVEWGTNWEKDLAELEKLETGLESISAQSEAAELDETEKKNTKHIIELLDTFIKAVDNAIKEAVHKAFKRLGKRTKSSSEAIELELGKKEKVHQEDGEESEKK